MGQSSLLLLLLLVFGCCTAYMRKNAGTSGFDHQFEESSHNVEMAKAQKLESVLNAVVPSGNRAFISALFEPTFRFWDCEHDFHRKEEVVQFVLNNGHNYSFKIHTWLEWEVSDVFNFTVFHDSQPEFLMHGSLSRSTEQLDVAEMLSCPKKIP